jgi:hypothetical protein
LGVLFEYLKMHGTTNPKKETSNLVALHTAVLGSVKCDINDAYLGATAKFDFIISCHIRR